MSDGSDDDDNPFWLASRLFPNMTDEQWAQHDAEVNAKRAAEEEAERRSSAARKLRELSKAGFPLRAIEAAESPDLGNSVLARVATWMAEPESVLVLAGPKGRGKTVAATWWAMQQNYPPQFVRAATFAAGSRYDRESRDAVLKAGALVLDDLGAEFVDAKGSFLVDLDELIDVFYGDKKPLLITTNCTAKAFKERYGDRIADRLRECGAFFEDRGESLRVKLATRHEPQC